MSMVEHNFLVNTWKFILEMWEILSFLCYFGSLKGPRPSRYPHPGAQTNACATLVKIDFDRHEYGWT